MKVSSYIKIKKSANGVLNLIKSPNNLEKFHPYCISNKVDIWDREKSVDYVHYYSGKIYKRKFTEWNKNGYVLDIYNEVKTATISWIVKPEKTKSIVIIEADAILPFNNVFIRYIVFHLYIKFMIRNYLNSVLKGLKYHLEKDELVIEDQFGKHDWYSA